MAVPVFPGKVVTGIFAWDAYPNPTKLYIYARGITTGEMRRDIGYKKPDGTFVLGSFMTQLNAGTFAAGNDAIDLGDTSSFSVEEDTDQYSPHEGEYRGVIALVASAA